MQCLVKVRNVKSVAVATKKPISAAVGFNSAKISTSKVIRTNYVSTPLFDNNILKRSLATQIKPAYDPTELENREHNANVLRLITAYRRYGHVIADLDPLGLEKKSPPPELDLSRYGLDKVASDKQFPLPGLIKIGEKKTATLSEIVSHLKQVYCAKIGSEFLYTQEVDQRKWFSDQVEALPFKTLTKDEKLRAYKLLAEAEIFDHFMQKKFPFIKRYALEGTESMMVAIDQVFESSTKYGVDNIVIGMPHRGRLNFLVNLLEYPARQFFWKVKGNSELPPGALGIGDVMSHIGQSVDLTYQNKKIHINLLQNPSHLEAVTPVALGKARAKQDFSNDKTGDKTVAVLFHGDASFYGQGTIAESLILSKLPEFKTGGAVHIIVNNQLGFTTAPTYARSSRYSADIGKMIDVPVIHVNADHPEEVAKAVRVAVDFRQKFREDIIIDIVGYRRHGHNELDEPSFTSPLMYNKIRSRPSVVKTYGEQLIKEGVLTPELISEISKKENERLEEELKLAAGPTSATHLLGKWKGLVQPTDVTKKVDTGVSEDILRRIAEKSVQVPEKFEVHDRLRRTFAKKRVDDVGKNVLDWATCESMAFGSLLLEGINTRICGQDVGRGTFSQRHAELIDQNTEQRYIPLNHIQEKQAKIRPVNSPLSELAVLGFEYGYSLEDPKNLVLWEAQFGDFANGAQVMIDQFISSGEPKWLLQTGITILLPHGYDGAGPEHSNSRPERFLQLVDGDALNNANPINRNTNMYVANASTPANYFHLLRRQIKTNYRKPLIVMSPKAILRSPKAVSKFIDIAPGTSFLPVIGDTIAPQDVKRVVLMSGKIYYEFAEEREKRGYGSDTALVRVEEFAPFPVDEIKSELSKYGNATEFIWAQEEPQNGGFWSYVQPRLNQLKKFTYVGRPSCPASAVGTSVANKKEYENLLNDLFPKK